MPWALSIWSWICQGLNILWAVVTPPWSRLLAAACAHPCFQGVCPYNTTRQVQWNWTFIQFRSMPASRPCQGQPHSFTRTRSSLHQLCSPTCVCARPCRRLVVVVRGLPMRPCFPHSICFSEASIKCISCSRRRGSDEFPVAAFLCLCLHSYSRFISQVSKYPRQRERAVKVALFILVSEEEKKVFLRSTVVCSKCLLELV